MVKTENRYFFTFSPTKSKLTKKMSLHLGDAMSRSSHKVSNITIGSSLGSKMQSHLVPHNANNSFVAYKMSLHSSQKNFLNVQQNDVLSSMSASAISLECKHWQRGTCWFGDKCKKLHQITVKVSNVPRSFNEYEIEKVAMQFGNLMYYPKGNPKITVKEPSNGYAYGMALVDFANLQSALDFINYVNDTPFNGVVLYACVNNNFKPRSTEPLPVYASSNYVSKRVIHKNVAIVVDEDGFQLPKRKGKSTAIDITPMKSRESQREDTTLDYESENLIKKILGVSNNDKNHQKEHEESDINTNVDSKDVAKPIETTDSTEHVTTCAWYMKGAYDDCSTLQKKKTKKMVDVVDTTETRRAVDRCWYTKKEFCDYYGSDYETFWESAVRNTLVSVTKSWTAALCPNIDERWGKKLEDQYSAAAEHTNILKIDFERDAACEPCDEPVETYAGFVQHFEEDEDETGYENDVIFAVMYCTTRRM